MKNSIIFETPHRNQLEDDTPIRQRMRRVPRGFEGEEEKMRIEGIKAKKHLEIFMYTGMTGHTMMCLTNYGIQFVLYLFSQTLCKKMMHLLKIAIVAYYYNTISHIYIYIYIKFSL